MADTIGDVLFQVHPDQVLDRVYSFATVGAVYSDGLSLIFDGSPVATEKHYKCNTSVVFKAGDRVKIFADSGTYVVEYIVGVPTQT